jgi:hypothetical protein
MFSKKPKKDRFLRSLFRFTSISTDCEIVRKELLALPFLGFDGYYAPPTRGGAMSERSQVEGLL